MLTVSSYATRTSPVLRGKWILDNLLDAPPPDPPPGTCRTSTKQSGRHDGVAAGSRWKRTARNPTCAVVPPRGWTRSGSASRTTTASARGAPMDGKLADRRRRRRCPTAARFHGRRSCGTILEHEQRGVRARAHVEAAHLCARPRAERQTSRTVRAHRRAGCPRHDYRVLGPGAGDRAERAVPDAARDRHAMIITGRHLPRRTFLRGLGRRHRAAAARRHDAGACRRRPRAQAPLRLAFTYVPNGVTMTGLDAGGTRARVRAVAHPQAAGAPTATTCSS